MTLNLKPAYRPKYYVRKRRMRMIKKAFEVCLYSIVACVVTLVFLLCMLAEKNESIFDLLR